MLEKDCTDKASHQENRKDQEMVPQQQDSLPPKQFKYAHENIDVENERPCPRFQPSFQIALRCFSRDKVSGKYASEKVG